MSYKDPKNASEIFEKLKSMDSAESIEGLIEETFPNWLKWYAKGYTVDYPHLTNNWKLICDKINTTPKVIIITDSIFFDKKDNVSHNLLMTFCETMTRNGYVVRRKEEFTVCEGCLLAMPTKKVWMLLKSKNMPVPNNWSSKCSKCS